MHPLRIAVMSLTVALFGMPAPVSADDGRCSMWIDLYRGEPVAFTEMLEDLSRSARCVPRRTPRAAASPSDSRLQF